MTRQQFLLCGPAISADEIRKAVDWKERHPLSLPNDDDLFVTMYSPRREVLAVLPAVRSARLAGHDYRIDPAGFAEMTGVDADYSAGFLAAYCGMETRDSFGWSYAAGYAEGGNALRLLRP